MKNIGSWSFGDTKKETDDLLKLVLAGKKKATSSLYDSYSTKNKPLPKAGDKSIIKDSKGKKRCLIKITRVSIKPFNKVTKTFAKKEGEGDLSLDHWRKTHKGFFSKRFRKMDKIFDEKALVVCEEFRVMKIF